MIQGITSKIDQVTEKIKELTKKISDALPGSPVKTGPLTVLNNGYAGGQIVKMLADGMSSEMDRIQMSANIMGSGMLTGFGANLTTGETGSVVKNYNITQNITTQEINPVRQAAALGWEVTTVM